MDATPRVLANKGITVALGEERVEVRLTVSTIADIEEVFGSIEEWQQALQSKPSSACGKTLAIAIDRLADEKAVLKEMGAPLSEYMTAITVAWAVANGLDPTVAAETYGKAMEMGSAAAAAELLEAVQEATKEV